MAGSTLCTVCIPTFNQVRFLDEAVSSAIHQSYPSAVLVSNDASTDATEALLSQFCNVPNVAIVNHCQNRGVSTHVRWLLEQPTTPFIVRLDSDDILDPMYVERLLALMLKYPEAGYAHCAIRQIDGDGKYTGTRQLARQNEFEDAEHSLRAQVKGYKVAANVIMFRRQALSDVGFTALDLNFVEDYDLSLRIAAAGWGNAYVNQSLASYRVWEGPERPKLSRKLHEIVGLDLIFGRTLQTAFRSRGWDLRPLRRRRLSLAIQYSEILDSIPMSPQERTMVITSLKRLAGSESSSIFLDENAFATSIRRCFRASARAERILRKFVKQRLFHG